MPNSSLDQTALATVLGDQLPDALLTKIFPD